MKIRIPLSLSLIVVAMAACGFGGACTPSTAAARDEYHAHLTGRGQLPIPVDTRAQGEVQLRFEKDHGLLHYRIILSDIRDVTMAHIHIGTAQQVGGLGLWLYPSPPSAPPPPGVVHGTLIEGTATPRELVGLFTGGTFDDLIGRIESAEAYVNVHTAAYPAGEIRGQIEPGAK